MSAPYKLVLADPPWRFKVWDRVSGLKKAPDFHYSTMADADIGALPVKDWAAKDALLVLWVYDPQYFAAFELARAWGFETYVTVLFRWLKMQNGQMSLLGEHKTNYGLGYHTRGGGCEECWLFRRGKGLPVLNHGIRKEFYAPVREHSRKPDEVRPWLVDLYGDVPRLEMFARSTAPGWDVFGNEVNKFEVTDAAR